MVASSKKNGGEQEFGVPGMETKRMLIPALEKPNSFSIPREHAVKKDFVSVLQRQAAKVPSPAHYKYDDSLGKGGKFFISKGSIPTYFTQVIETSKKLPGVGKYDIFNEK